MRCVVLDTTEKSAPWLSTWWTLGSYVSGADVVVRAASWPEAYDGIVEAGAEGRISDLQVWGHGDDGRPLIAGSPPNLLALAAALGPPHPGDTVWWRSCETHRGPRGQMFAAEVVRRLGRTSVGHCVVISAPLPWRQGAICALRPGESPWWPLDGAGLPGVSTLRMSVPAFAYVGGVP